MTVTAPNGQVLTEEDVKNFDKQIANAEALDEQETPSAPQPATTPQPNEKHADWEKWDNVQKWAYWIDSLAVDGKYIKAFPIIEKATEKALCLSFKIWNNNTCWFPKSKTKLIGDDLWIDQAMLMTKQADLQK